MMTCVCCERYVAQFPSSFCARCNPFSGAPGHFMEECQARNEVERLRNRVERLEQELCEARAKFPDIAAHSHGMGQMYTVETVLHLLDDACLHGADEPRRTGRQVAQYVKQHLMNPGMGPDGCKGCAAETQPVLHRKGGCVGTYTDDDKVTCATCNEQLARFATD